MTLSHEEALQDGGLLKLFLHAFTLLNFNISEKINGTVSTGYIFLGG